MHKNQHFLIFILALSLAALSGACERREPGVQAAGEEAVTAGDVMTAAEQETAMDLARSHIGERFLAREAVQRASNQNVRDYAHTLVDDHTEALRDLTGIMQNAGVPQVEERPESASEHMEELQNLAGEAFDRKFVEIMIEDHEQSVQKLQRLETTLQHQELKQYVSDLLPTIQDHLQEARELESELASGAQTTE